MVPDAAYAGSVESVSDFTSRPPTKKLPWRAMVRGPGSGRAVCADAVETAMEQRLAANSSARMETFLWDRGVGASCVSRVGSGSRCPGLTPDLAVRISW